MKSDQKNLSFRMIHKLVLTDPLQAQDDRRKDSGDGLAYKNNMWDTSRTPHIQPFKH